MRGLSRVAASEGYSWLHCIGFSLLWLLLLWSTGCGRVGFTSWVHRLSGCSLGALALKLNSCGTWAWLLHSVWNLLGPGIKPMSPAFSGRFLSPKEVHSLLFLLLALYHELRTPLPNIMD